MSEMLKRYLKIQIEMGKLTKEEVIAKYPEIEDYLK
jgi:hypothetical protein